MLDRVRNLAQFIKDKKNTGEKFVLMLGAGASLSSGIKLTATIIDELVAKYRKGGTGSIRDQFDQLWSGASREDRRMMLEQYLDGVPSEGFRQLAELIQRGYFDLILTLNFDRLLEGALNEAGFNDYKAIIRGETSTEAIAGLLKSSKPRVKIVKMHGSLESADCFLFSEEEMLNYPNDLESLVSEITGRDIIICGYAFSDMCMMRAFNTSKDSGSIYFVNPSGAVDTIKGFLIARRSQEKVVGGELGKFDAFFDALYNELCAPPALAAPTSRQNLFKFLDYYQEDQKSWFGGRRKLTRKLVKRFDAATEPVFYLTGRAKVGKTSFVRAGLIPYLDATRYELVYIRCRNDIDLQAQLRADIERRFSTSFAGLEWPAVVSRLADLTPKRLVIFLDQFERPFRPVDDSDDRKQALLDFVNPLVERANDRVTIVFVASLDSPVWRYMFEASAHKKVVEEIKPLSRSRVARILRYAARKGGVPLDQKLLSTLCDEYQQSLDRSDRHFTLMHLQTICYYLARGFQQTWQGGNSWPPSLAAALDSIKDEAGLIDLLEDLPWEERRLIRSFLKVICDPTTDTRKIIAFIRNHFPEIKQDRYPEPIV